MFSVCSWVGVRRGAELSTELTVYKTLLPCLSKLMLAFSVMIVLGVSSYLLCLADTITGPNEPIPILDFPMMPSVMTVEALTNSPACPSERRAFQTISHPNIAAYYGPGTA